MTTHLSPGVRPAVTGAYIRGKRVSYYRYRKTCVNCLCSFVTRNTTAKTCGPRCRKAYERQKRKGEKEAAARAAAVRKKRKKGANGPAPRKKTKR
jgi:hypothetical protein